MISIDISSLTIVTSPAFGSTSHRKLRVNYTLTACGGCTHTLTYDVSQTLPSLTLNLPIEADVKI